MKNQARMYLGVALMSIGIMCIADVHAGLDMQTYSFYNITNNSGTNAATGQSQLFVEVFEKEPDDEPPLNNLVGFKFTNTGLEDCVITEIYFQGGSILEFD